MRYWEKALETVGENVMIVSEADDIATQRGPMMSHGDVPRVHRPATPAAVRPHPHEGPLEGLHLLPFLRGDQGHHPAA